MTKLGTVRICALLVLLSLLLPQTALGLNTESTVSLYKLYEDYFLIGSVFSQRDFSGQRFELMKEEFNVLTAENAMKPDALQKNKGTFTFSGIDSMVELISAAGIKIHGHTLAWHQQSPGWMNTNVTRAEAEQNMADHVNGAAGHFAGKMLSWDVLNEAMNDGPQNPSDWRSSLRKTEWYNAFAQDGNGEDYIYTLFKLAREADPNAILYYNDYNMNDRNKAQAVYNMVKELNEAYLAEGNDRLLIEGVGMQGHYSVTVDINSVKASIELFSELGVEISITELDIGVPGVSAGGLTQEDEIRQGLVYAQLFALFKEYSDVIERVTFWGVDDASSWRAGLYPLLFNPDLSPKMAYFAVAYPEEFLSEYSSVSPKDPNVLIQQGTAAYGTPDMSGRNDAAWNGAQELPVAQMLQAWQTASGTVKALWDEQNLYVLVEVRDSVLDNASVNVWEQDSVEIFVDEENCKEGAYNADDGQYRVSFENTVSFGGSTDSTGFVSFTEYGTDSYVVGMTIPFKTVTPEEGMIIGFDAQINDGANGVRIGMSKWNDASNDSYLSTKGWGELLLTAAGEEAATTPEQSSAQQTEPPAEQQNTDNVPVEDAETPWILILCIVAGVFVAACLFAFLRKH